MVKTPLLPPGDILQLKVEQPDGVYRLDDYQMSESVGYLLKRSYLSLSVGLDQELAPYDLTHPQFSILMILKEHNCLTAADLARATGADTGAVTRMLDRLEAKQIIQRERSCEDRRIINIQLTEAGKMVVAKMPVVAINVLNRRLQHFDAAEIDTLKTLLRKLLQPIDGSETAP
jgi:MarR family transcriptional regulator, multiple antibiotic resistance protein MarR